MLTFGSLFAGIGGIDLGLERAGMRCVWQVEKDDYATRVLEKHWPNVPRFRDARECGAYNLPAVDLIAGGFPCQPHSTAGKRQGAADERDLWPEFRRIIGELRPRWVLAENVPGLLSTDAGRFFGGILGDLATLGYDAEWECIPAAAVGAPHIRDRVYIVAYTQCHRRQQGAKILCPRQSFIADGSQVSRTADVPHAAIDGRGSGWTWGSHSGRTGQSEQPLPDVAHAPRTRIGRLAAGRAHEDATPNPDRRSQAVADADRERRDWRAGVLSPAGPPGQRLVEGDHAWAIEPDVGRMAHGVPARVDRLRGLGNAVVPEVAEFVGRYIIEAEVTRCRP